MNAQQEKLLRELIEQGIAEQAEAAERKLLRMSEHERAGYIMAVLKMLPSELARQATTFAP